MRPYRGRAFVVALVLALSLFWVSRPEPAHAETAGDIFVVDVTCCGGNGGIFRVNPATGQRTPVATTPGVFDTPVKVALAADGKLYVADEGGAVIRIDPAQPNGSNHTAIATDTFFPFNPADLAIAADGTLYVIDACGCGGVLKVDPTLPDGSNVTPITFGLLVSAPVALAIGPDGKLYVLDALAGVVKVDTSQSAPFNESIVSSLDAILADPDADPHGITVALDGTIYVVDAGCCDAVNGGLASKGGVLRINPQQPVNSNWTIIAAQGLFVDPTGIALAADGTLLVTDAECCGGGLGGVIRVNPAQPSITGANQTAVSTSASAGPPFGDPHGLAVVPGVSIGDAPVTEGTGNVVAAALPVTLAPWSSQRITVPFATGNGTATGGADFVPGPGSVTFNPGQTTVPATVPVIGDQLVEPAETFAVTLQPPAGVGTTRPTGTVTIQDDDGAVTISIGDIALSEGTGGTRTANFPVTLTPASGQVVTVKFLTGNGSATAGPDFEATSGTLTFQPGETTKPVPVTIISDIADEPDESFTVTLSAPSAGATIGRAQATGVILDDDLPVPAQACAPRPRVNTRPGASGGALHVNVEPTPLNAEQNNRLTEIRFGQLQNAVVTLNGQPIQSGQTFTAPPNTVAVDFTVTRATPGQATTVPFVVVDACGDWPTFVGGGAGAGF